MVWALDFKWDIYSEHVQTKRVVSLVMGTMWKLSARPSLLPTPRLPGFSQACGSHTDSQRVLYNRGAPWNLNQPKHWIFILFLIKYTLYKRLRMWEALLLVKANLLIFCIMSMQQKEMTNDAMEVMHTALPFDYIWKHFLTLKTEFSISLSCCLDLKIATSLFQFSS